MTETRILWDMPITVTIVDAKVTKKDINSVFAYFTHVDDVFNTFRQDSEISRINAGHLPRHRWSKEVKEVLALCEETKRQTNGFFEIRRNGVLDPLGIVKGWAVHKACDSLLDKEFNNYYIEAGGDIETHGSNDKGLPAQAGKPWTVGIKNPFNRREIVKKLIVQNMGIATSGTYIRGNHIINPFAPTTPITDIVSLTVIGPDILEADRIATAAFAMGKNGITFIETLPGFEGYLIDSRGRATFTRGFAKYVYKN
jgi:thiamine biosynthesis lipoprotein